MASEKTDLDAFYPIDKLPKTHRGWGARVLQQFFESNEQYMRADFDENEVTNKYASLSNALRKMDDIKPCVKVHRYGNSIVLERIDK